MLRAIDGSCQHAQSLPGEAFPVSGAGSPDSPMRGRDAEWRIVCELLRGARRGHGGVLLVEGEGGTGKSLLLDESSRKAAGQGFSLATSGADELAHVIPLFAMVTALNKPFDESTADDRPDWLWRQIGQLQARLEQQAMAAPVLVCLDDLQWASRATLLALRTLPRLLARHPVAWILARSKTRQDKDGDLLFSLLEREGATRLTLTPLADDAVATLLVDAFGAPPDHGLLALAGDAAGNPSLLAALIGGLRDDKAVQVADGRASLVAAHVPRRIDLMARKTLEGLSGPARKLLETAAVLGQSFRLEDAAEMLDDTSPGLLPMVEETVDAGIIAAAENSFVFRHGLMWQAIVNMIPLPARSALHRQFGEVLLIRGDSAASAAGHLLEGAHSDDPATMAGLDKAAARALQSSPQAAAQLALRALELTPATDPGVLPRSAAAAEALTAACRLEQAGQIVQDAFAGPVQAPLEARLRCALSSIHCIDGRAGLASYEAQAALAQPQLPQDLRDQATTAQLQAVAGLRDGQAATRISDAVLAAPDEHGDQVMAAAQVVRAMICWDEGRVSETLGFLHIAAGQPSGVSPDARHVQPLLALAASLVDLRRFSEAETVIRTADTRALDGIPPQAVLAVLRARIHLAKGRLDDAAAEGETALGIASTLAAHSYIALARSVLGAIALRKGDIAAAGRHIASRPVQAPYFAAAYARSETAMTEARLTAACDDPAAALGQIRGICAELPAHPGVLLGDPVTSPWLVRMALAADDHTLAARVARAAEALARANPQFEALTAAAAHSLGLLGNDHAHLAQAAAQHPEPWAQASAAEDLGVLLATHADREGAIKHLDEALHGYGLTSATTDQARVRQRLRRLGVRRRHWATSAGNPVTGWESLTETERAASELVAQGLNNKQVATRMFISVHTVAFHLGQVFRKLQISSRVELTRIVLEREYAGA